MPATPTADDLGMHALHAVRKPGTREAITEPWKDDMVHRLLLELKRQLCQLENTTATPGVDEAPIRERNMRTLANIERTLTRLLTLEEQRTLKRETRMATKDDDVRAALKRRLDEQLAAMQALEAHRQPKP